MNKVYMDKNKSFVSFASIKFDRRSDLSIIMVFHHREVKFCS